jgi:hypothetical protein
MALDGPGLLSQGENMDIRVLLAFLLAASPSLAVAADGPIQWAFVNGSATGYSMKLESASPAPGTPITVGQTVEFKFTVSYELSLKDKGAIVLVIQDETNKRLDDGKQQSENVLRGKGTVTLTQSLMVPAGREEVMFFIPLVPAGISHTSGELVVRYPVADAIPLSPAAQPSAESVRRLLSTTKLDALLTELADRQKTAFRAQLAEERAQQTLNGKQKALLDEYGLKALSMIDDEVQWPQVETMMVAAYQGAFSQQDVDALIEFYSSESGRAVLAKLPQAIQVLSPERITEWDSMLKNQGERATLEKIKEELGVAFRPSEVDGFCKFFASPVGKHIVSKAPALKSRLERSAVKLQEDTDEHLRALATDYEVRIEAAGAAK